MKAQILLTVEGAKHLIAKALCQYIDFNKRVYIAYGTTNNYLLYHLGITTQKLYAAGCNTHGKLNVTSKRDGIIVLKNGKLIDIENFDIGGDDIFIKGANALWYENNQKNAAVAAADPNGGTYGNFYIKAVNRGSEIIIPVGHEKLIPFFTQTSQNVDFSTGSKVSMLRFFSGKVFTEIEAFKILFNLDAKVFLSGGIEDCKGAVGFLVEGENVKAAVEFAQKYNNLNILKPADVIY